MSRERVVSLSVGSGGKQMQDFIEDIIHTKFSNDILLQSSDSAILDISHGIESGKLAFTTDSFIVQPEFFNGGDIGKLSICGTVNDLAVSGAIPKYISLSLIIPEGYKYDDLERVLSSIQQEVLKSGVKIVTGDTKVMPIGTLDSILINTSGIGEIVKDLTQFSNISLGDNVIVTSDIARHSMAIMLARDEFGFVGDIESDSASLNKMMEQIYSYDIKFARDATRGGLSTVLNEITSKIDFGIEIHEEKIPIRKDVESLCKTLGFDPLSLANEGVIVLIVSRRDTNKVIEVLSSNEYGRDASVIGEVSTCKNVVLNTFIGGRRYVEVPHGEILPRIC